MMTANVPTLLSFLEIGPERDVVSDAVELTIVESGSLPRDLECSDESCPRKPAWWSSCGHAQLSHAVPGWPNPSNLETR
jgi:hypothetical protein